MPRPGLSARPSLLSFTEQCQCNYGRRAPPRAPEPQACQCACAQHPAGAPLELRKRRWITPALYVQIVLWFVTLGFLGARMLHACLYV